MKGSIQKKGKIFYAVVAFNGKRMWFKGGDAKKDAQRVLNEKLPEIDQGTYRDLYGHLFNDANFNRQQVELLEDSFRSVRNPLEKSHFFETATAVNH